jgi:threonine synthase
VALVSSNNDDVQPVRLAQVDDSGEQWLVSIQGSVDDKQELRVAMLANSTTFYGSSETTFFTYDTVFPRDDW